MRVDLTAQQVAERFELAQLAYGGKIRTFARNSAWQLSTFEVEDVCQELLVVLWECVRTYNPDKGASFNTFFQQSARNRIISLVRHCNTKGRSGVTVSLDVDQVRWAVEEFISESSAEELAMIKVRIQERIAAGEVVGGGRRRKAG